MSDVHPVLEFMQEYRAAFIRSDAAALADFYGYPLQLIASGPDRPAVTVAGRDEWQETLRRLVRAYQRLRVGPSSTGEMALTPELPGVWTMRVQWYLRADDGRSIYDFTAVYTIVASDQGFLIVAISHDELPKIAAALHPGREPGRH